MGGIRRQSSVIVVCLFPSICCSGLRSKLETLPFLLLSFSTPFNPGRRPSASSKLLLIIICHRRVKLSTTNPFIWRGRAELPCTFPLWSSSDAGLGSCGGFSLEGCGPRPSSTRIRSCLVNFSAFCHRACCPDCLFKRVSRTYFTGLIFLSSVGFPAVEGKLLEKEELICRSLLL